MEEEMINFIMVWSSVLMLACYCYGVSKSKSVPKGTIGFFMLLLPALCLCVLLPLNLNSVNLTLPTAFSVTWLTTFKILLLGFGTGPLSSPSLSLIQFVTVFSLPIKIQWAGGPKSPKKTTWSDSSLLHRKSTLHHAKNISVMVFLILLGCHGHMLPRDIVSSLTFLSICTGFEIGLEAAAVFGQLLLGIQVEPPFDGPYSSTSFQDFWGRRWNRVTSSILRSTVFDPALHHGSRVLGRELATFVAVLVTFVVSGVMHEIVFYYVCHTWPGWGSLLFCLVQWLCVVIESTLKRRFGWKWQLPQILIGPLIYAFVAYTFMRLALPELTDHNLIDRALKEYAALGAFVMDLGLIWVGPARNLLTKLCFS